MRPLSAEELHAPPAFRCTPRAHTHTYTHLPVPPPLHSPPASRCTPRPCCSRPPASSGGPGPALLPLCGTPHTAAPNPAAPHPAHFKQDHKVASHSHSTPHATPQPAHFKQDHNVAQATHRCKPCMLANKHVPAAGSTRSLPHLHMKTSACRTAVHSGHQDHPACCSTHTPHRRKPAEVKLLCSEVILQD
eukprot:1160563-Pelagomonas_calceolata.AAC.16